MQYLAVSMQYVTDEIAIQNILESLKKLLIADALAEAFLAARPDFELLLEQARAECRSWFINVLAGILSVIILLLPEPYGDVEGFRRRELRGGPDFAKCLHGFAQRLLLDNLGCPELVLRILASVYRFAPPTNAAAILDALTLRAAIPALAEDAFRVVANIKYRGWVVGQPILGLLELATSSHAADLHTWYGPFPAAVAPVPVSSIADLDDFCALCARSELDFFRAQAVRPCVRFLRGFRGEVEGRLAVSLEKLAATARAIVGLLPVPADKTTYEAYRTAPYANQDYLVRLQFVSKTNIELRNPKMWQELLGWETTENIDANTYRGKDELQTAFLSDPQLRKIVSPKEFRGDDRIKLALLNRAVRTTVWTRFAAQVNGQTFSMHDSIYRAGSYSANRQEDLGNVPDFFLVPTEGDPQFTFAVHPMSIPDMDPFLELLREIHAKLPQCDCVCPVLSDLLIPRFAIPDVTIARWSSAISTVWSYPFAFPLDVRVLFFKLTAFHVRAVFELQHERFGNPITDTTDQQFRIPCHIDQDQLFEQGVVIFERFGPGRAIPVIHLDVAHGSGPTREFFTLFSSELCAASRRLWRNPTLPNSDQADPGEFGLFPRPAGDPQLFYIMGIMCAKAICTGCFVAIRFNPVFFEIAWGLIDETTCVKIDPELVKNLRMKDGLEGCVFVSPDVDAEELITNGWVIDVTPENAAQYVQLVEERMICKQQAEAFARGFGTALPWDATRVFSANEFLRLLVGIPVEPFTIEGLQESIDVSNGYDRGSPQIAWFFEVLVEMDASQRQDFMQFLTGMRFGAEGGLQGLNPRLTIGRVDDKVDEWLPSVSTCAHYFKLPAYSSREILKERLATAVENYTGFAFE
jgi:hypothetical protein